MSKEVCTTSQQWRGGPQRPASPSLHLPLLAELTFSFMDGITHTFSKLSLGWLGGGARQDRKEHNSVVHVSNAFCMKAFNIFLRQPQWRILDSYSIPGNCSLLNLIPFSGSRLLPQLRPPVADCLVPFTQRHRCNLAATHCFLAILTHHFGLTAVPSLAFG